MKSNAANLDSAPLTEPLPQSEQELLRLRETQAKAAMKTTAKEIGQNLLSALDIRPSVREHPWKSSGIAALAGFFVGLKVVPSSSDPVADEKPEAAEPKPSGPSPWASLTSTLVETGSGAVKAAVLPWLAQKIAEWMPKGKSAEESAPETNAEEVPFSP